jgi:hypothetical protein
MFGFVPSDYTTNFRRPLVIFNGEAYPESCAIAMMSGNVNPRFFSESVPENKILRRKAIVTESDENCLRKINGAPASEFMEAHGMIRDGNIWGAKVIPFIIDFNDGTPWTVRVLNIITPDGFLILGGEAKENSTIELCAVESDDIVNTASYLADAVSAGNYDFLIIASCVTRNFILELDNGAEIAIFRSRLGGRLPFLFLYTGGEICPVVYDGESCLNRFHNLTLTCCAL